MSCHFPHLFTPLKFGSLVSKNRIFSAPMGGGADSNGHLTADAVANFEEIARSGVGVVCMGEAMVHNKTGNNHGDVVRLDEPGILPILRKCTDGIHRHGARASIELLHPGRRADPKYTEGGKTYGPSGGMAHYGDGEHYVTEMDEAMIELVVNAFGDAAEMAMLGGCDMVTVQAAHGWLLTQFLSPNTNWRTDRFGGSIENRGRIFVMVAENIREKCGKEFGIDFRISGSDFMENGATLEDVVGVAKMLDGKVDMLHISAASFDDKRASIRMFPCMFYERGCNAFLAEEIKKNVSVPVVTVGGFDDPEQMEKLIAENRVDAIALGRALLADKFMPEKARLGRADDIMFCTRCQECMSVNFVPYVKYPLGVAKCAVNPWEGLNEKEYNRIVRRGHEKVLVVGGGPAGMEAALGAAECGHDVILAEKSSELGGMLKTAWHPEFKKDIKRFVEVLSRRISKYENIRVSLNTAVTPAYIKEIAPDSVIVAIGAEPIVPDIKGVSLPHVILSTEIHEKGTGNNIVFIGGGMVGCEEGLHAAKYEGKNVTIIEMSDTLAKNAPFIHYISILSELEQLQNLKVLTETTCKEIRPDSVVAIGPDGNEQIIHADTVVLSAGMNPKTNEAWNLYGIASQTSIVGDCKKPARMNEAVADGYFAGFYVQKLDEYQML